jgi:hypothetical protein
METVNQPAFPAVDDRARPRTYLLRVVPRNAEDMPAETSHGLERTITLTDAVVGIP